MNVMNQRKTQPYQAQSGITMLMVNAVLLALGMAFLFVSDFPPLGIILTAVALGMMKGYFTVSPTQGRSLFLLGNYQGSITEVGFYWAHPFLAKQPFSKSQQYLSLKNNVFSDMNGLNIEIDAVFSWKMVDLEKVFSQSIILNEEVEYKCLAATADTISTLPYFVQTDQHSGKKVGLKGQKGNTERLIWHHLQQKLEHLGVEPVQVSILKLSPPPSIAEIQQASLVKQQADKKWAMQAVPLAAHIFTQYQSITGKLSEEDQKGMQEEIILTLIRRNGN